MDLLCGVGVCDGDFVGRDSHDGAVAAVEGVDEEGAPAREDGEFEGEVREARPEGAGEGADWGAEAADDDLVRLV